MTKQDMITLSLTLEVIGIKRLKEQNYMYGEVNKMLAKLHNQIELEN